MPDVQETKNPRRKRVFVELFVALEATNDDLFYTRTIIDARRWRVRAPSEKHLEDWICGNIDRFGGAMDSRIYFPSGQEHDDYYWVDQHRYIMPHVDYLIGRQMRFMHGRADLVGMCISRRDIYAIELKADAVNLEAVAQVARYISDIREITGVASSMTPFDDLPQEVWNKVIASNPVVRGLVVGFAAPDESTSVLAELLNVHIAVYDYDPVEGYTFELAPPRRNKPDDRFCSWNDERKLLEAVGEIIRSGRWLE